MGEGLLLLCFPLAGTIKGTLVIALGGSGMFLEGGAIPLVVPCMLMPVPGVVTAGPMAVRLVLVSAAMLVPGAPVTAGPLAACACGTGGVELSASAWGSCDCWSAGCMCMWHWRC